MLKTHHHITLDELFLKHIGTHFLTEKAVIRVILSLYLRKRHRGTILEIRDGRTPVTGSTDTEGYDHPEGIKHILDPALDINTDIRKLRLVDICGKKAEGIRPHMTRNREAAFLHIFIQTVCDK